MNDLEQAIKAVECGLLPVPKNPDQPAQNRALIERMKHYIVTGFSVALIDREEVAWAKGYGVCEPGCEALVTPETIFQAASISEVVKAMMALRLVDQGLLDLDVDANDVLYQGLLFCEQKETIHEPTRCRSQGIRTAPAKLPDPGATDRKT